MSVRNGLHYKFVIDTMAQYYQGLDFLFMFLILQDHLILNMHQCYQTVCRHFHHLSLQVFYIDIILKFLLVNSSSLFFSLSDLNSKVVLVDNGFTKLMAAGLQPKLTNVWVGKICPLVEDFIIKQLLDVYFHLTSFFSLTLISFDTFHHPNSFFQTNLINFN
jgi:hypothetical protein